MGGALGELFDSAALPSRSHAPIRGRLARLCSEDIELLLGHISSKPAEDRCMAYRKLRELLTSTGHGSDSAIARVYRCSALHAAECGNWSEFLVASSGLLQHPDDADLARAYALVILYHAGSPPPGGDYEVSRLFYSAPSRVHMSPLFIGGMRIYVDMRNANPPRLQKGLAKCCFVPEALRRRLWVRMRETMLRAFEASYRPAVSPDLVGRLCPLNK